MRSSRFTRLDSMAFFAIALCFGAFAWLVAGKAAAGSAGFVGGWLLVTTLAGLRPRRTGKSSRARRRGA